MRLIDVYTYVGAETYLYALLLEREASINISHQAMPTPEQHLRFVHSRPYTEWHLIHDDQLEHVVGAVYLSKSNEIGIFVFKQYQGNGYGKWAVNAMALRHKDKRLLANVNPKNAKSAKLFKGLGFGHVQNTFARERH